MLKKYNLTQEIMESLASKVSGGSTSSKSYTKERYRNNNINTMVKTNVYRKNDNMNYQNKKGISYKGENNNTFNSGYNNNYIRKRVLVIFTGTDVGIMESVRELSMATRYGVEYDVAFSESGSDIIDMDIIKRELNPIRVFTERDKLRTDMVVEGVDAIIVPMTTQNTVAKLSLGIQDTFTSFALWQSLWHGKPVLMDYKNVINYRGNPSKSPELSNIMKDYVNKLGAMGVVEVNKNSYVSYLLKALNIESNNTSNNSNEGSLEDSSSVTKKTLITEKDLIELSKQGSQITIPRRTIVTPLAYDTAKELGIKIIKE